MLFFDQKNDMVGTLKLHPFSYDPAQHSQQGRRSGRRWSVVDASFTSMGKVGTTRKTSADGTAKITNGA